jgi:hypothetical protein
MSSPRQPSRPTICFTICLFISPDLDGNRGTSTNEEISGNAPSPPLRPLGIPATILVDQRQTEDNALASTRCTRRQHLCAPPRCMPDVRPTIWTRLVSPGGAVLMVASVEPHGAQLQGIKDRRKNRGTNLESRKGKKRRKTPFPTTMLSRLPLSLLMFTGTWPAALHRPPPHLCLWQRRGRGEAPCLPSMGGGGGC